MQTAAGVGQTAGGCSCALASRYSLAWAALGTWLSGLGKFDEAEALQALTEPLGGNHLPFPLNLAGVTLLTATFGWLQYGLTALSEALGWRGLLVPELIKIIPFAPTAILSGCVWALWHEEAFVQ